jgi:hypothetical protein
VFSQYHPQGCALVRSLILAVFAGAAAVAPAQLTEPQIAKQVEHPVNTPVADFFGGSYGDSTDDPATGVAAHDGARVDMTIGEEWDFIVTFTFPEGTTESFDAIDITIPVAGLLVGGRQDRVIELLSAEVIHVGTALSGPGIRPLGFTFSLSDNYADGDNDRTQLIGTGTRNVENAADGVLDDGDRYVIRIHARLDDEDNSGGPADSDSNGPRENRDGDLAGNRVQTRWIDTSGVQQFRNNFADIDIVEPALAIEKFTILGDDLVPGDVATFELVVTNNGTAPAYNVVVTDTLPTGGGGAILVFDAIDPANSTCDDLAGFAVNSAAPPDVVFSFDDLAAGTNCTLRFDAIVQAAVTFGDTYINTSAVTSYDSRDNAADLDNRNYAGPTSTSAITASPDCNGNGQFDATDIASGASTDCNNNTVPDDCESDCNSNGLPDDCDIAAGTSDDCNTNGRPDECDVLPAVEVIFSGAPFGNPSGVAQDAATGDFVVIDFGPDTLFRVTPGGAVTPIATGSPFGSPFKVAQDAVTGDFIVTDIVNDTLYRVIPGGVVTPIASGSPFGLLTDVVQDATTGDFIVTDQTLPPALFRVTAGGVVTPIVSGPPLSIPVGVTQDAATGDFIVVNFGDVTLSRVTPGGVVTPIVSGPPFVAPISVAQDAATGDFIVADQGNATLFRVTPGGVVTPIAAGAPLSSPFGLTQDAATGDLVVIDIDADALIRVRLFASADCNANGIPDECDPDCNANGVPDECDIAAGTSPDCNFNGVPDACDVAGGNSGDCNTNGIPDECEEDCDSNGLPDECDFIFGSAFDCNNNGRPDSCDIDDGVSNDCNANQTPDICEPDCDNSGFPDECDVAAGTSPDCNSTGLPDSCEIAAGTSADCNNNSTPDECEPDCNNSGFPDDCDVAAGTSADCNNNVLPDECDLAAGTSDDCNFNQVPDECEPDCNNNGTPDDCDVISGTSPDCNFNGSPDACDIASGTSEDCQSNGIPDECDIAAGDSNDNDADGIPNECDGGGDGWPSVDVGLVLTANQPTYWSVYNGAPGPGGPLVPFTVLSPNVGGVIGRPDPEGSTERVLRGFLVLWAVDASGNEIRWNHLSGKAVTVNYDLGAAWEYNAYAFQTVDPNVAHGANLPSPGFLFLNGQEYASSFDLLLLDFYATGADVFNTGAGATLVDTDLTLLPMWIDLRQETFGPATTKANFTVWNQNEFKLTGLDHCVTCWDQALFSNYEIPNHLLRINLQTNKGKARIDGLESQVCDIDAVGGDGPLGSNPDDRISEVASLLGVAAKQLTFAGGATDRAGMNLVGMGTQSGLITADILGTPPPEREEAADQLIDAFDVHAPGGVQANGRPRLSRVVARGEAPGTRGFEIDPCEYDGKGCDGEIDPPIPPAAPVSGRVSFNEKGSLLVFPAIELRWNAAGTRLIQDTFIELTNDYPGDVNVQLYYVDGDPPA